MKSKKYEVTLSIISILTVLVTAVGLTFAYFTGNITGTTGNVTANTATIGGVTFDGGSDFTASTNIEPGWKESKTFSITVAPTNVTQTVLIKLDYTNDMPELLAEVSEGTGESKKITLDTTGTSQTLTLVSKTIAPSETTQTFTYTLTMELPETGVPQNQNQGKVFDALLYADFGENELYYNAANPTGTTNKPQAE